jgi:hypothetical protein
MSANRSVQAAQRRRAGNIVNDQPQRKQTPTTSINSAQMFAGQGNIPSGRLAGQQAALAQKQMMQKQYDNKQESNGIVNINKMTLAQAITLITLRLGKIETIVQNNHTNSETMFEKELIHSIMERLDLIEQNTHTNLNTSNLENSNSIDITTFNNLQNTIDKSLMPLVTQSRTKIAALSKENINLKNQINDIVTQLQQTKEQILELQNILFNETEKHISKDEVEVDDVNESEEDEEEETELIEGVTLDIKDLIGQEITIDGL